MAVSEQSESRILTFVQNRRPDSTIERVDGSENCRVTLKLARDFWHGPDEIWRVIGRFESCDWMAGIGTSVTESGPVGNRIGMVRAVRWHGAAARQRLTAHSDALRRMSFETLEPHEDMGRCATMLAVHDRAEGGARLVWEVAFDMPAHRRDHWADRLHGEVVRSFDNLQSILELSLSG
jgi:hypothetical protein